MKWHCQDGITQQLQFLLTKKRLLKPPQLARGHWPSVKAKWVRKVDRRDFSLPADQLSGEVFDRPRCWVTSALQTCQTDRTVIHCYQMNMRQDLQQPHCWRLKEKMHVPRTSVKPRAAVQTLPPHLTDLPFTHQICQLLTCTCRTKYCTGFTEHSIAIGYGDWSSWGRQCLREAPAATSSICPIWRPFPKCPEKKRPPDCTHW